MKNFKKISNKTKLGAAVGVLIIVVIISILGSAGVITNFIEAAVVGYDKTAGQSLTAQEWNAALSDAVSFQELDSLRQSVGEDISQVDSNINDVNENISDIRQNIGDIFVNWGSQNCPGNSQILYGGYGFGSNASHNGDASLCLMDPAWNGFNGGNVNNTYSSAYIYPLGIFGAQGRLPSNIEANSLIKCATCYNPGGTCYTAVSADACATGFNKMYDGYMIGRNGARQTSPRCVDDQNFDSTESGGTSSWQALRVPNNLGLTLYSENRFITCSFCCK